MWFFWTFLLVFGIIALMMWAHLNFVKKFTRTVATLLTVAVGLGLYAGLGAIVLDLNVDFRVYENGVEGDNVGTLTREFNGMNIHEVRWENPDYIDSYCTTQGVIDDIYADLTSLYSFSSEYDGSSAGSIREDANGNLFYIAAYDGCYSAFSFIYWKRETLYMGGATWGYGLDISGSTEISYKLAIPTFTSIEEEFTGDTTTLNGNEFFDVKGPAVNWTSFMESVYDSTATTQYDSITDVVGYDVVIPVRRANTTTYESVTLAIDSSQSSTNTRIWINTPAIDLE